MKVGDWIFAALLAVTGRAQARGSINAEPISWKRTPAVVYEENRTMVGDLVRNETLSFRLSRYGAAAAKKPVLVQVHEWGGDFARMGGIAAYEPAAYGDVMLSFQYKPSTGNEDDWWFGTGWNGETRSWALEAVADGIAEAQQPGFVDSRLAGVSTDPNRFHLFGHSAPAASATPRAPTRTSRGGCPTCRAPPRRPRRPRRRPARSRARSCCRRASTATPAPRTRSSAA